MTEKKLLSIILEGMTRASASGICTNELSFYIRGFADGILSKKEVDTPKSEIEKIVNKLIKDSISLK